MIQDCRRYGRKADIVIDNGTQDETAYETY